MNTFHLSVITPDGVVYDDTAEKLSLRGICGDLAVLAGHIPFATSVMAGDCRITDSRGKLICGTISSGLLTVSRDITRLLVYTYRVKD